MAIRLKLDGLAYKLGSYIFRANFRERRLDEVQVGVKGCIARPDRARTPDDIIAGYYVLVYADTTAQARRPGEGLGHRGGAKRKAALEVGQ
jgi:hypothetical protein